jgi:phage shock protein C
MNRSFAVDRSKARLMGVCAGFADWTRTDPLHVRLAAVLLAIVFAPTVLLYLLAGLLAPKNQK